MSESESPPSRSKMSRRQFIGQAVNTISTLALASPILERNVLHILADSLTAPKTTDTVIEKALSLSELDQSSENPEFRPFVEILNEGIEQYSRITGKSVHYSHHADYKDVTFYGTSIKAIANTIVFPKVPEELVREFTNLFPGKTGYAYIQSNLRTTSFPELFTEGSGFYSRFKLNHPDQFSKSGSVKDYSEFFAHMETDAKRDLSEIRSAVESNVNESEQAVSASFILEKFLEKNNGDLAASIYDTGIFLKFMARSDFDTAAYKADQSQAEWFKSYIRDEYQGAPYTAPQDSKTQINLVGKPYHSWNLVAMLHFFPRQVVQGSGLYRQLITLQEQGIGKTRADLQTLRDLPNIEATLSQISSVVE